jgi:lipopolysaccharide biosynthesis glycosyltransferase
MKVAVVVFVVGSKYVNMFESKFKKNLNYYCQKQGYELIILSEMIRKEEKMDGQKFLWQKLLIPSKFMNYDYVVVMDADIFVNPNSPPLPFNEIPDGKIGCVNERKYMGNYEWRELVQIRFKYEKTGKDWYKLSGVDKNYHDHMNSGVVIYQPKHHANILVELYDNNIKNYMKFHQGDQSILSIYFMDNDLIYWIDERFNRVWGFWKEIFYPFFNHLPNQLKKIIVANCINLNYFTHFTGGEYIEFI